jgi:hypothetical protein
MRVFKDPSARSVEDGLCGQDRRNSMHLCIHEDTVSHECSIRAIRLLAVCLVWGAFSQSVEGARPVGEPQLDRPTLHSLGVSWIVREDHGRSASIRLEYRKAGATAWRMGAPLFRVERGAHAVGRFGSHLKVPADAWLFEGSVIILESATEYELKLTLVEATDGKETSRRTPPLRASLLAVTTHVSAWFGRGAALQPRA